MSPHGEVDSSISQGLMSPYHNNDNKEEKALKLDSTLKDNTLSHGAILS